MKPRFKAPPHDWERYGKATVVPTEDTLPKTGDWVRIADEDGESINARVLDAGGGFVTMRFGKAIIVAMVTDLEIHYTRMGTFEWFVE